MKVVEYLSNISTDEVTERLKILFENLERVHNLRSSDALGYFFKEDMRDTEVNEQGLFLPTNSLGKIIDDGFINEKNWDIIELCAIGICAYDHVYSYFNGPRTYFEVVQRCRNIRENINTYVDNNMVPEIMREYFIDIFERAKYEYAHNYYSKNYVDNRSGNGNERGMVKVYATPQGKALTNHDDNDYAFVDVLLVPAIITLTYLVTITMYFIFFK